ncbi:MAG: DUF2330 domain-containing protein [Myxococcota bacterium]|nr:DUF2330 domain-containing protein [Myxococcota bacterium]
MSTQRLIAPLAALFALALTMLAAPPAAEACGGFFCSGAPVCTGLFCSGAPTQQSGENLIFSVEDDGTLTVHIQILYQGESDAFAWILPLPSVPTSIDVGTDSLFTQLDAATSPRFDFAPTRQEGTCRERPICDVPDAGQAADGAVAFADAASAGDADSAGPMIHLREEVGPYDAVVLSGDSAEVVLTWLRDNEFDIPTAADPLIADYVAARHVFVAIRLLGGRSAGEIQPLTLTYAEGQPCVPLRLTAVAATMDMPITAYFLADSFVAPSNYSSIEPDLDNARLWSGELSYRDHVGRAIDDAGGRAFVTDYAGAVPPVSLSVPDIAELATIMDPMAYLSALLRRGFMNDPQLLAILPRFLPVPEGQTPQTYYNCLTSPFGGDSASCGYVGGFDPAALTTAIDTQILAPRRAAQAMLARHPRLTRLFTTMDPSEMSLDPLFRVDAGLPAVSNVHTATPVIECSDDYYDGEAPVRIDLPGGTSAPWSPGTRARTADEWCTANYLLPPGTHAARAASSSGCTVSYGATSRAALVGLALALALVIARRKKS